MIDTLTLTATQLLKLEVDREPTIPGWMIETKSTCPIINHFRFNLGFVNLGYLLMSNDGQLELQVAEDEKNIHLAFIGVPDDQRKKGKGSALLKELSDLADRLGYTIDLIVDPKFGVNRSALYKFYRKNGFEDKGLYHSMIRYPKEALVTR